ncbi:MAG: hypothetical protein A3E81_06125 [Gammaproteobacteria bacterium RIFCSPHIGHO2_12_FULL_36_30]|nr:MAG: hypothetical protein A3E81_06125 [Gammaproteobacteria bacterium RIFCSPHIGHO2_12_FULL_36_30]
MMHFKILEIFLIILFIALIVTIIFRHAHIPIILGYVLVGTLVGPNVLGWLQNTQAIKDFAEFGVVLLMFTVGLEFSLPKLFSLWRPAFILGSLQIFFSSVITVIIGILLNMPLASSIVIGAIVAMSSTAIVTRQLLHQNEINTKHGENAIGILLFQDLAVIPILILMTRLSANDNQAIWLTLLLSFTKGVIAIAVILASGKWILKPLLRLIAGTQMIELFTLGVLFVSIGAAWFTNFLGLSYALGAFFSGIMLAECELKEKINAEIRPFRDVLLGLFFISIGMLVNVTTWPTTWHWILLLVLGLMIGKGLLITVLSKFFKDNIVTALRTGLILAQGSEFGFAILTIALSHHLLPENWGQVILAALLISFVLTPIIVRYNKKIAECLIAKSVLRL